MNMFDRAAADERDVKTYIRPAPIVMLGKHGTGGLKKPGLLARHDRMRRLCKAFAGFYLDKNKRFGIRDDQVDLSCPGPQPLREHAKSLSLPMLRNEGLRAAAAQFCRPAPGSAAARLASRSSFNFRVVFLLHHGSSDAGVKKLTKGYEKQKMTENAEVV
jgi:hypothetical protein